MLGLILILATAQPAAARECTEKVVARHVAELRAEMNRWPAGTPDADGARRFFRALPASFGCFNEVFGYPRNQPAALYEEPQLHTLFPILMKAVPPAELSRKLIHLAVGARWEADQTGALQQAVRNVLGQHPEESASELKALSESDEYSAWRFLFGGPHPSKLALPEEVRSRICALSSRSCALERKAYDTAVLREAHH